MQSNTLPTLNTELNESFESANTHNNTRNIASKSIRKSKIVVSDEYTN